MNTPPRDIALVNKLFNSQEATTVSKGRLIVALANSQRAVKKLSLELFCEHATHPVFNDFAEEELQTLRLQKLARKKHEEEPK